jgi:hypothetical protein
MDIQISAIKLYQIIRYKTGDDKTAEEVVSALQASIKEEVRVEATNQIKDLKIDIIDRIGSAKIQTILWVVGVGVLQLVAHYFLK